MNNIPHLQQQPRHDTALMAVAFAFIAAIVFWGFAPTYYLKAWFETPALSGFVHLHGALMTAWIALFLIQVALFGTGRVKWHRRLGTVGAVLAATIVLVGWRVALSWGARENAHPSGPGPAPLPFMGFLLWVLVSYALLVGTALLLRRRPDYHKRLMLLSCFALMSAGVFRLSFPTVPTLDYWIHGGPGGVLGLDLFPVYLVIAYDTWHHRRLHPAFVGGTLVLVTLDLPFVGAFFRSEIWTTFAGWLVT